MKIKLFLIAINLSIWHIGCSNTIEIPKEVYVPVKCKIAITPSPKNIAKDENDFEGIKANNNAILVYTEILENDIKVCRGE